MLLKFKKNLLLINILFFLMHMNILHADECGVLRYLANKSNGVTVTGNTCGRVDDIALGSEFNLMPGARLWFKSTGTEEKTQGICQNRSSKFIRISVDSGELPWINPNGLANCSSWTDNKMNCEDSIGGQNALSCVIATIDAKPHSKESEERTTSVRMRSIPTIDDPDKTEPLQKGSETEKEQIVLAMQPDIDLCRAINHTDTPIKITWRVEVNGRVNTVIPVGTQNDADKSFMGCLSVVIKDFSYPKSSKAIWLSNQF